MFDMETTTKTTTSIGLAIVTEMIRLGPMSYLKVGN